MTKKTTSTKSQGVSHSPLATPAFFVAVVAAILSIFTLVYVLGVDRNTSIGDADTNAKLQKVVFCYDNDISPCNNTTLQAWNDSHDKDQQFKLK